MHHSCGVCTLRDCLSCLITTINIKRRNEECLGRCFYHLELC
jgi:hypothetical protein